MVVCINRGSKPSMYLIAKSHKVVSDDECLEDHHPVGVAESV